MFACAHPAIEAGIRAPLMLQVVLGLDAKTIASAFLISPAAMGKRLVRAKDKIRQAGIPFRIPEREELAGRLDAVLDAIYAAFAEGWTDPAGTDVVAPRSHARKRCSWRGWCASCCRSEPEALGLLALMLHAEARRRARRNARRRVCAACRAGSGVVGCADDRRGRSAAAARRDARRRRPLSAGSGVAVGACLSLPHGHANWAEVVRLYDALFAFAGSPVVAINRALAIAELHGRAAGLEAMPEPSAADARLAEYQPYWAARAELLARTVRATRRGEPTRLRSASSATPRCGASCSGGRQGWHSGLQK